MANSSFYKNVGTNTQLQGSASASAAAALASEQAALASKNAAALSETNSAASAASALVHSNAAASSVSSINANAISTAADVITTAGHAATTTADAITTTTNAASTAADVVLTNADVVSTNADAVQTAADRVQTGVDATASSASAAAALASENVVSSSASAAAASATSSSADATATAADRVQTGLDRTATNADAVATAADRVQTGLDATASASSASAASTSAGAASASQVAAAASAAAAENSYDQFDDRYLGSKTGFATAQTGPSLDNDGNALVSGTLFFSADANEMRVYDGAGWIAASSAGSASLNNYHYTATAAQTTFSGSDENSNTLSYTVNNLIVTRNGIVLEDGTDYTATNGTSVVLAVAAAVGDEINIVAFKSFTTADMVSATNGGTFQGNVDFSAGADVTGNITVTGTVDGRDVATDGTKLDGIEALADVTDATNVAAAGALMTTGGSVTGDVSFGDNDKAVFGAGSDLQIYHDGSHSYVKDAGTGNLYIEGTNLRLGYANGEYAMIAGENGSVEILHDNATKLATSTTGVNVTGALTTTAGATIAGGDLVLDEGSPEIIFQTGGSHYNWMIAAQENVSNTLEISSGSQDGDYSNDTFTPRLVINSSGHVGINNTAPSYPLVVQGNAANHCSAFYVATNGYAAALFYDASNTFRGQIQVGTGGTGYLTVSDYRLKTAVNYEWDATTRLKQLRPARFEWTADGDDAVPVDGFLAHEVQDIVPEAISGTKDAMRDEEYEVTPAVLDEDGNEVTPAVMGTRSVPDLQGIDQSKLTPLLTKALIEAVEKIEQLEARIAALETA